MDAAMPPRHDIDAVVTAELDIVQPFQLDRSLFRGRLVRLGPSLDEILRRHDDPSPIASLLGETIVLAALLSSALKYEGIFTLQTKGDGPVAYTVADVASVGDLRGYAGFRADKLAKAQSHRGFEPDLGSLLGAGYLAFTVDQGEHTERYQGIVELRGRDLTTAVNHYFRQSEQLATSVKAFVGQDEAGGWRGGAVMLQALPPLEAGTLAVPASGEREEDWLRATILLETLTAAELLNPDLPANDLIYRLFHEEQPRVFARSCLRFGCRCSRERVEGALVQIAVHDLDDLLVEGKAEVRCEFCNETYTFDKEDIDRLYANGL
jgi:molecular chaperone Hsp33